MKKPKTKDTLLLDQGYQPLAVIPWQRAFCMHVRGKVEVVEHHDWKARSCTSTHAVPAVVRLKTPVRYSKPKGIRFSRTNVYLRDEYVCQYCSGKFRNADLTLDHVMPRSRGGRSCWNNIVTCCVPCNRKKRNRTPDEAHMPLKKPPIRPKFLRRRFFHYNVAHIPDPWKNWVFTKG